MKEIIHCEKCKRPILKHEIEEAENIVYCRGCNYYFPISKKASRKRNESVIPSGTNYIRYRIEKDELEITFNWIRNYRLGHVILNSMLDEITITSSVFAFLLNKTKIHVSTKSIRIEHKPIDLLPMVYYQSGYVKQLFVKRLKSDFWKGNIILGATYGLFALLKNGKEELWIWDLNKKMLLFIEQEIERTLGIDDFKVENEVTE